MDHDLPFTPHHPILMFKNTPSQAGEELEVPDWPSERLQCLGTSSMLANKICVVQYISQSGDAKGLLLGQEKLKIISAA